ncbi:putative endo-1,4-beta-xylanase 5-like [Cocos nucifera]|uniref:Putative endo-1,4-beta-xylanase 5-like n=1 Tax=Cocos nucifera TaxID=13894 RepID=A0A8K0N4I1_COCNU|nr:putative endo-1,4-beta-xylanase 5-like [Cocos nucifera]
MEWTHGPPYDYYATTECKAHPEAPLYNGGILVDRTGKIPMTYYKMETGVYSPAFVLYNLTATTRYSFSCWVKTEGTYSTLLKARLSTESSTSCIGTALASSDCWSFLKGGFVLDSPSQTSIIYFQNVDVNNPIEISVTSPSLQPFSVEQWKTQQEENIRTKRKRAVTVHVSDSQGNHIVGASVTAQQLSKDFPFGSAIAKTILGNAAYQAWFSKRFNAAVFENELKWYTTEPDKGKLNYTLADELLGFVRANQIVARGHNIFWEDPKYTPSWVQNLTGEELRAAVKSRIDSLLTRYKGEFVHWDVSNEMLHFDFYEQRLGYNATLDFFATAQNSDPLATLFMNDFNVIETCDDVNSTVDSYASRLKELKEGGAILEGVGLEGHFSKPNIPLMRAVLDKLATLKLPIWLTEIDISNYFDQQTQAIHLEEVLREGFSHPSMNGIMLWTAIHPYGCYQMCLTDGNFRNLPAGDVVDNLLQEWETKQAGGATDERGYPNSKFFGLLCFISTLDDGVCILDVEKPERLKVAKIKHASIAILTMLIFYFEKEGRSSMSFRVELGRDGMINLYKQMVINIVRRETFKRIVRRSKRVLELGSGYGLAGLSIAGSSDAHIQRNISVNAGAFGNTKVKSMTLHWNEEPAADILNSFDVIVASDCTFFKEFHESLARIVKSLLKYSEGSEAIFLSPRRGDSLDKFLEKIMEASLQYELVEKYDSQVWNLHQHFLKGQHETSSNWNRNDRKTCWLSLYNRLYIKSRQLLVW